MIDMIEFADSVDKFLRHQMSQEDENAFLSELKSNPDNLKRAKVIEWTIQEMGDLNKEVEQRVLQIISNTTKDDYLESIWASPKMD